MNFYEKSFYTHSLTALIIVGVLSTLLGILFGWIMWRRLRPLRKEIEKENEMLKKFVLEQEKQADLTSSAPKKEKDGEKVQIEKQKKSPEKKEKLIINKEMSEDQKPAEPVKNKEESKEPSKEKKSPPNLPSQKQKPLKIKTTIVDKKLSDKEKPAPPKKKQLKIRTTKVAKKIPNKKV